MEGVQGREEELGEVETMIVIDIPFVYIILTLYMNSPFLTFLYDPPLMLF